MEKDLGAVALPVVSSSGLGPQKSDAVATIRNSNKRIRVAAQVAVETTTALRRASVMNRPRARSKSLDGTSNPSASTNTNTNTKPTDSFATLIKAVILASPHKRLLLHEIYESIACAHPYFRTAGEGWKNSIRHNLSINTSFCKIPRAVLDDPQAGAEARMRDEAGHGKQKKGCYWILRDLTSIDEERMGMFEERRRRSLAHLFATGGAFPGPSECIRILPFTHVPTFIDIGRRHSASLMLEPQDRRNQVHPAASLTINALRKSATTPLLHQQMAAALHGPPAGSYYQTTSEMAADGQMVGMQPLSIEGDALMGTPSYMLPMGMMGVGAGEEMPWLATSPQISTAPSSEPLQYTFDHPMYTEPYQPPQHLPTDPRARQESVIGFGLPRRDLKDIWFNSGAADTTTSQTTHYSQEKPSQFRQ